MSTIFYVAIAIAAGLLMTRLAKLVKLPNVTAYLVAGLIIGPFCLNIIPTEVVEGFNIITSVALGFIAFSIGGEFKLSYLKMVGKKAVIITMFEAFTAMILVDVVLIVCGVDVPLALALGAIANATAPAATLMVVRQYKAKGDVTRTLLPVVAMDDAAALMAFSISAAVASSLIAGDGISFVGTVVMPLVEIIASLIIGGIFGLLIALGSRLFNSRANRLVMCIAAVFMALGISRLVSDYLTLSDLLMCMAMGAVYINLRHDADRVIERIEIWTTPLFLMFFVVSGAELDLSVLPTVGLIGVLYLVARSAGKYLGAFAGASLTHAPMNVRKYLGFTLLPQAGVAIGLAQVASNVLPEYASIIRAVILAATLVYELFGPVITKIALTKAGEIAPVKKIKEAK